jgi:hypothetical protein
VASAHTRSLTSNIKVSYRLFTCQIAHPPHGSPSLALKASLAWPARQQRAAAAEAHPRHPPAKIHAQQHGAGRATSMVINAACAACCQPRRRGEPSVVSCSHLVICKQVHDVQQAGQLQLLATGLWRRSLPLPLLLWLCEQHIMIIPKQSVPGCMLRATMSADIAAVPTDS